MRELLKATIIASASILATAGVASASLVIESWDEANPAALVAGAIPGGSARNDVIDDLGMTSLDGYYGSQIRLAKAAKVTYTFLGFEASYANRFVAGSGVFDTEDFSPVNSVASASGLGSFMQRTNAGLLDFSFITDGGANGIVNGEQNTNNVGSGGTRKPDFFVSILDNPMATSGRSLLVFLDDLGAGPDDDHDDMAVRIDLAAIPLPAGIGLTGTALAALWLLRRRRT